jgi:hypothetical protein
MTNQERKAETLSKMSIQTSTRVWRDRVLTHLRREGNHFAYTLATLADMAKIEFGCKVQPVHIDIRNFSTHYCLVEEEIDGNP